MKLILTHEVTNLGAPGDIVEVKDGYGRNFLLPRNFAIRWTKGGAKQVESIKAARDAHAIHDLEEAQSIKGNLEASPINVPVRAGVGVRQADADAHRRTGAPDAAVDHISRARCICRRRGRAIAGDPRQHAKVAKPR